MRVLILLLGMQAFGASVKVKTTTGVRELGLEDYTAGVVAGEAKTFHSTEAMKAMAVTARTFAIKMRGRHQAEGFDFCSNTHCQAYQPSAVDDRIREAVQSTAGEMLWYRGAPVAAYYSQDCGGVSEVGAVVWPELAGSAPYLRQHNDSYCSAHGRQQWNRLLPLDQVRVALRASGFSVSDLGSMRVRERTASGRARVVLAGSEKISASSFRFAIDRALGWNQLRSDWFDLHVSGGNLSVQGYGTGHGVGLCQHGADAMGSAGHSYREILAEYYPGTVIGLRASGIEWTKISGEHVELWTVGVSDGPKLMRWMDRDATGVEGRLRVQVYNTVDLFRDATGEPGWVAASTRGRTIRLAPAGLNETTFRHEVNHLSVESRAKPGLPLWFREGVVLAMSGEVHAGGALMSMAQMDSAIAQTSDAASARRGYAAAGQAVHMLMAHYGRSTVEGWVSAGVPVTAAAEVNTMAAQKSR